MGEDVLTSLRWLLSIGADNLNAVQMSARAVVVFVASVALVRLGDRRFLGKNTAFDVIVGFTLGSVLSRAINGSAALLPTLAASFVLVGLHYVLAAVAFRSTHFGSLVKGEPRTLVDKGQIHWKAMSTAHISENDLLEAVHLAANLDDLEHVQKARLERGRKISVITTKGRAKVVEVRVAEGVQTVRIEIE